MVFSASPSGSTICRVDPHPSLPYPLPPVPRGKKPLSAPKAETETEVIGRLVDAVEAVEHELRMLRDVLGEVRDACDWVFKNDRFRVPRHVVHVTHMPHVGRGLSTEPVVLPPQAPLGPATHDPPPSEQAKPNKQRTLFGSEE